MYGLIRLAGVSNSSAINSTYTNIKEKNTSDLSEYVAADVHVL